MTALTTTEQLFSQDAERALLGAALINPELALTLDILPGDFYVHRNQWIWSAMTTLIKIGINPDMVTLSEELNKQGRLAEIGGAVYLADLCAMTPSSYHPEDYAGIVLDYAHRRKLRDAANALAKAAYSKNGNGDDEVIRVLETITNSIKPKGAARPIAEYVSALFDDVVERMANPKDVYGIPTGLEDFDRQTGGLQPGESLYIGGDPGIGKSILSVQMGIGMAQHKAPGVIYSLEMRGLQVSRRIVSSMGRLETRKLKSGRLDDNEFKQFAGACEAAGSLPVYLSDEPYWTTATLRSDLARLKAQRKIEWFVLDYLYLMSDGLGSMKPTERTELLSSRIKLLCKEFDLAGITVNSMTKEGDLRGSNQVKHDADIIVILMEHQPDNATWGIKHENMRTLAFVKGRELESLKYLHLVKQEHYPAFGNFTPEPNAQRMKR